MKIHNIRLGFACNSSSTHSVIYFNKPENIPNTGSLEPEDDEYYGWETFTLTDEASKARYLAALVSENLKKIHDGSSKKQWKKIFGKYTELVGDQPLLPEECRIDHQSLFKFPNKIGTNHLHIRFIRDYVQEIISNDQIFILGGNDNGGEHWLDPINKENQDASQLYHPDEVLRRFELDGCVSRYDPINNYYTLMFTATGNKYRMSFGSGKDGDKCNPDRAFSPELVDLKITNKCTFNCKYCYMGSVHNGEHAPFDKIRSYIDQLAEMKVFEIALGGGEPTLHPDLIEIAKYCREKGIVPNLTTKNFRWIDQLSISELNLFGGIAVSIDNKNNAILLRNIIEDKKKTLPSEFYQWKRKISAQVVVGVLKAPEVVISFLQEYGIKITFLGFKFTGRGSKNTFDSDLAFRTVQYIKNRMLDMANDEDYFVLRCDTSFIVDYVEDNQFPLIADSIYVTAKEGVFSCAIDAVEQKIAKSSYASTTIPFVNPSEIRTFWNQNCASGDG